MKQQPAMNDWSFIELARLIERKQAVAAAELALESQPLADGWLSFGGPGAYVNKACGLGMERPLTDAELDTLVTFFTSRGVEPRIELCPFAHPSLLPGLAQRGFILRHFVNTLVRKLPPGNAPLVTPAPSMPPGLTIERVDPTDAAAVRQYVEVAESGFLPEGEREVPEVFMNLGLKAARKPTQDCFVARLGGEIVGAAGCEARDGATALFGTSVKPAWRRRGIQQALIAARLERARERGSQLATIMSSPGIPTERNAARLGFTMAYTRVILVKHGEGLVPS
jgi:GNAT superfamily N-acetyltransferase